MGLLVRHPAGNKADSQSELFPLNLWSRMDIAEGDLETLATTEIFDNPDNILDQE